MKAVEGLASRAMEWSRTDHSGLAVVAPDDGIPQVGVARKGKVESASLTLDAISRDGAMDEGDLGRTSIHRDSSAGVSGHVSGHGTIGQRGVTPLPEIDSSSAAIRAGVPGDAAVDQFQARFIGPNAPTLGAVIVEDPAPDESDVRPANVETRTGATGVLLNLAGLELRGGVADRECTTPGPGGVSLKP